MKFEFKQAVRVGRQIFQLGTHEVPSQIQEHATFKHFAKAKLVVPFVSKDEKQQTLKPATSEIAKVSSAAAKTHLDPEAEIGGDEEAAVETKKSSKKGK